MADIMYDRFFRQGAKGNNLVFPDDIRVYFGTDLDRYFVWDSTNARYDLIGGALRIATGGLTVAAGGLNIAGTLTLPAGGVLSAAVEADLIRYTDTQLTNAQVLALNATPITLVAAPGANRAIVVHAIFGVCSAAAGAYTETAGQDMAVEYASGLDIQILDNTTFMTTAGVQANFWQPDFSAIAGLVVAANSAVRLNKTIAEFGGGNAANTLSVRVYHSTVDMVAFT